MPYIPSEAYCKVCEAKIETHDHGALKNCLKQYKMELEQIVYHLNHITNPLYHQSPNEAKYILARLRTE